MEAITEPFADILDSSYDIDFPDAGVILRDDKSVARHDNLALAGGADQIGVDARLQSTKMIRGLQGEIYRLNVMLAASAPIPGVSINRLQEMWTSLVTGELDASVADPRILKILSLARKNRDLTVALHTTRDTTQRLASALRAAEARYGRSLPSGSLVHKPEVIEEIAILQARVKSLSTQLSALQSAHARVACERDELASTLKSTQTALQREVGCDVPLTEVLMACGLKPIAVPNDEHNVTSRVVSGARVSAKPTGSVSTVRPARSRSSSYRISSAAGSTGSSKREPATDNDETGFAAGAGMTEATHNAAGSATGKTAAITSAAGASPPAFGNSAAAGWRGRSQQIVLLKSRVADLERQLSAGPTGAVDNTTSSVPRRSVLSGKKSDDRASTEIAGISSANARRLAEAEAAVTHANAELISTRQKLAAVKARATTLESDLKAQRASLAQAKFSTDGDAAALVASLRSELEALKQSSKAVAAAAQPSAAALDATAVAVRAATSDLHHAFATKDRLISMLQGELGRLRAAAGSSRLAMVNGIA